MTVKKFAVLALAVAAGISSVSMLSRAADEKKADAPAKAEAAAGTVELFNGKNLTGWKTYPDMPSKFTVTEKGELNVKNGRGQLESVGQYADFVLQLECNSHAKGLNSGVFFRCIPGEQMNGYECQIHNGFKNGNRAEPADFFEATFEHGDVLIRTDVLEQSVAGTRLVEVKAGTHMRDEYLPDVAIQTWVLEGAGVHLNEVALAHINDQFVYRGGGEYQGLLTEQPIADLARRLAERVPQWTRDALGVIAAPEPAVPVGQHCRTPFECPFMHYCWPQAEYPLTVLPKLGARLDEYVARGYRDVRDVPEEEVSGEVRERVWRATRANRAEIAPALRTELRAIGYPRFYLDFETISYAVPIWPGTRPR